MAAAETARLIAELSLNDKITQPLNRIDRRLGAFSGAVNRNVGKALDAGIAWGIRAISSAITTGLDDLATLESATTSVDGAIAQMGLTGKVSAAQVAGWANEIETATQAAFDDKDIVSGTENLIRFGKVTEDNLRPAMEVMTDLAAKTGSVESASELLGKALADPARAAGKLSRYGVILTKQQQKQLKAMTDVGDAAGAQALLLDILAETTGGAAVASQGKYRDALNLLADASEDVRKALAEGFLPVIERISGKITELVSDPSFIEGIRGFGKSLAGAFDAAVDFAESVDWKSIGDGLKTAASWAKTLFDAFMSMPTEAKAAIFALAGLNKLSGGAIGGIVSELGKGLIKGVLGITAGVVNVKGAVVNGGGAPGGGPTAGATGGGVGQAVQVLAMGTVALAVGQALREGFKGITDNLFPPEVSKWMQQVSDHTSPLQNMLKTLETLPALPGMIADDLARLLGGSPGPTPATNTNDPTGFLGSRDGQRLVVAAMDTNAEQIATKNAIKEQELALVSEQSETRRKVAAEVMTGATKTSNATTTGTSRVSSQSISNTARMVGAINRIPAPVTNVNVWVTAAQVTKSTTTQQRSGASGGSRSNDNYRDPS